MRKVSSNSTDSEVCPGEIPRLPWRIVRIEPDRVIGGLRATLRVSEIRSRPRIERENLGVSGIEPQGRIEFRFAGGKVALDPCRKSHG